MDVGDIITISQGTTRILEVKEGIVNERILEIVHCKGDVPTKISLIGSFVQEYGETGAKQFERISRQVDNARKVVNILRSDRGFDPYRGAT